MRIVQESLWDKPSIFCRICGRRLTNIISIARGIGPVCAKKVAKEIKHELGAPGETLFGDVLGSTTHVNLPHRGGNTKSEEGEAA